MSEPVRWVRPVYGVGVTEDGFEVREVCPLYLRHLRTVVQRRVRDCDPAAELLHPDCRWSLYCACEHSDVGPLLPLALAVRATEAEAWEAVAVMDRGGRRALEAVPSRSVVRGEPVQGELGLSDGEVTW